MFKKITVKLALGFISIVIATLLIVTLLFRVFVVNRTVEESERELLERVNNISDSVEELIGTPSGNMQLNTVISTLVETLPDVIWIVNSEKQYFMSDYDTVDQAMGSAEADKYLYLPKEAKEMIDSAFEGNGGISYAFSELYGTETLTATSPIYMEERIIGVIILHKQVEIIENSAYAAVNILGICFLVGLVLATIIAALYSYVFTKPLRKMNITARRLTAGDYRAKTAIRRADEIGQLAKSIDNLSDELYAASCEREKLDGMRRDFFSNVSHELRTPITVLGASAEALRDGIFTREDVRQRQYEKMLGECRILERLVSDLLDLSRMQSDGFKLNVEKINLTEVLGDACMNAGVLAGKKGVSFNTKLLDMPVATMGDYDRTRQLFVILIDNAVKFTAEGGNVSVTQSLEDGVCSVTVADSGAGISKEELPHIFDRFYKTESESNKQGSGLGLAIAKEICQKQGVDVVVESVLGKGTRFVLKFKENNC